ncbi:uncharacterized protein LOC142987833 [Anticarsia gemmatalis]|uniref:uncharacterized protein LOC142987833 n=1 Tax=Anticarsia gemmatalis TaxID=129554 RepID=UPI003F758090
MALSPKKYCSNNRSGTAHRGVEAREAEFTQDGHSDLTTSTSSQLRVESCAVSGGGGGGEREPAHLAPDDTASYLQVGGGGVGGGGERGVYVLPHPVLLACPAASPLCHALQRHNYYTRGMCGTLVDAATCASPRAPAGVAGSAGTALAAGALLLAAPLGALLAAQRAALVLARGAAAGAVQNASDYALKPALALTYNALLRPLLVFAANVARGLRDAARPLAEALGDAVEPAARLLAAVRLVHVHVAPPSAAERECPRCGAA